MKNLLTIIALSIALAFSIFGNLKQCSTNRDLNSKLDNCRSTIKLFMQPGEKDTTREQITERVQGHSNPSIPKPDKVEPVKKQQKATDTQPAPDSLPRPSSLVNRTSTCDSIRTYRIAEIDSVLSYHAVLKTRGYLEDFNLKYHVDKTTLRETITETKIRTDTVERVKREPFQLFLTGGLGSNFEKPNAVHSVPATVNTLNVGGMAVFNKVGVGYEYDFIQKIHELKFAFKLD